MWKRTSAHNTKLIAASNALHTFLVVDLGKYRKSGFVKKVQKAKKPFSYRKGLTKRLRKTFTKLIITRRLYNNGRL